MSFIDLKTATGYELDAAGRMQLIHRHQGEDDASFRKRLMQADLAADMRSLAGGYPLPGGGPIKASEATLRDYFAAKAMSSVMSNSDAMDAAADGCASDVELMVNVANRSYAMADAMLAERAK